MIYVLVLSHGDIDLLRHSKLRFPHTLHHCIGLLFVCRQVHAETALLPYELNTFNMLSPSSIFLNGFLKQRTMAQRQVMMEVKWWWYSELRPEVHSGMDWLRRGSNVS
jgi:hypothetical protein